MGAHPKNKITRAERGKRRAGNTPSLKKDHQVSRVPLHKRGLVASILRKIGVTKGVAPEVKQSEEKKGEAHTTPATKPAPVAKATKATRQSAPKATVKRTQHKG